MLRLDDWQCSGCDHVHEALVGDAARKARKAELLCPRCGDVTDHDRMLSMPAKYVGDRPLNPQVYGSEYDTMGAVQHEPLPQLQGANDHMRSAREVMARLPNDATGDDVRDALETTRKDAPSSADYQTLFESREWKDTTKKNDKITKANKQKKARAAAIGRGDNISMRDAKCEMDPNMTA